MKNRVYRWSLIVLFSAQAAGCVPLPGLRNIKAYQNERLKSGVNDILDTSSNRDDYFIGLAISGGGSRAANFAASVMWELDRLGVLKHVQYISAVSGGALPAAYYSLFRDDPKKWNEHELKRVMSQNFELSFLASILNPFRWPLFFGTGYDRTDILASVFGNLVFENKTYGEIPRPDEQMLIVNATNLSWGGTFSFNKSKVDYIQSDLKKLPVAVAVAASAAYPGVLRAVTLRNFGISWRRAYLHLIDGGVADNLALETLSEIYGNHLKRAREKQCLLMLVDAHLDYLDFSGSGDLPERAGILDSLVDTNALSAVSILLQTRRDQRLYDLGFDETQDLNTVVLERRSEGPQILQPLSEIKPYSFLKDARLDTDVQKQSGDVEKEAGMRRKHQRADVKCDIWRIALSDLAILSSPPIEVPDDEPVQGYPEEAIYRFYKQRYDKVNQTDTKFFDYGIRLKNIPTRFYISEQAASDLFLAGELLVQEEKSKKMICKWLKDVTENKRICQ